MKIHTVSTQYMAFSLSDKEIIGEAEAKILVKEILKNKLLPCWEKISIEMFAGVHEALYLAHPLPDIKISIAPCLLPFLGEYFTE